MLMTGEKSCWIKQVRSRRFACNRSPGAIAQQGYPTIHRGVHAPSELPTVGLRKPPGGPPGVVGRALRAL